LERVRATGEPYVDRESAWRTAGRTSGEPEEHFVNISVQPLRGDRDSARRVFVHAVDVTEQRIARRQVERSEAQLRLLTDTLPVLIAYIDSEYRFRFANAAYMRWFGLAPAELVGRSVEAGIGQE